MGQVTDLGYKSSYSGDQIDGYLGMVAAANAIGGAGVAPAGFGFDGRGLQTIEATSASEPYETFCGKIDAILNTMAGGSVKAVRAYPPQIYGYPSNPLATLYNSYGGTYAALYCPGDVGQYYGGWRMCKLGGTWQPFEWFNPPLTADVEYRTTERFLGKPVYQKLVSIVGGWGSAGNTGQKVNPHGIPNISTVVGYTAWRAGLLTPAFYDNSLSAGYSAYVVEITLDNIVTYCGASTGGGDLKCLIKYAKTTD